MSDLLIMISVISIFCFVFNIFLTPFSILFTLLTKEELQKKYTIDKINKLSFNEISNIQNTLIEEKIQTSLFFVFSFIGGIIILFFNIFFIDKKIIFGTFIDSIIIVVALMSYFIFFLIFLKRNNTYLKNIKKNKTNIQKPFLIFNLDKIENEEMYKKIRNASFTINNIYSLYLDNYELKNIKTEDLNLIKHRIIPDIKKIITSYENGFELNKCLDLIKIINENLAEIEKRLIEELNNIRLNSNEKDQINKMKININEIESYYKKTI